MTHTPTAEDLLMGSMLMSDQIRHDAYARGITPDTLQSTQLKELLTVVQDMDNLELPVEAVAIRNHATRMGYDILTDFVTDLRGAAVDNPQVIQSYSYYIDLVLENARKVRAVKAAQSVIEKFQRDPSLDIQDQLAQALLQMQDPPREKRGGWLSDLLPGYLDDVVNNWHETNDPTFIPTGLSGVDRLLRGGMRPGELVIVGARPGMGKALGLDTPIPTPDGWTTMGDLKAGDTVFDEKGEPCKVTYATPVQYDRTCYRVVFSDGSEIVADADHRWLTWDVNRRKSYDAKVGHGNGFPDDWSSWSAPVGGRNVYSSDERDEMRRLRESGLTHRQIGDLIGRSETAVQQQLSRDRTTRDTSPSPVTTQQIRETLRVRGMANHVIPLAKPVQYDGPPLPIDPWVLGYMLGDGDSSGNGRVACDPVDRNWLMAEFGRRGYSVQPYKSDGHFGVRGIRSLWMEVVGESKRVPDAYLRASYEDRVALLAGLIDSDGSVDNHGAYRFTNTNKALIDAFCELAVSIGQKAKVYERKRERRGRPCKTSWDVVVPSVVPLSLLPRKKEKARHDWGREQRSRSIVDVVPVESVPVRCITVDSPSHLYLAGESMIPTHNTAWALQVANNVARTGKRVLVVSAEMTATALIRRASAEFAGIAAPLIDRRGPTGHPKLDAQRDEYLRLMREEMIHLPIYIDDTPRPSVAYMLDKAKRLGNIDLVIFDYLGLANDGLGANASANDRMTKVSTDLMMMAKDLNIPVIALSQLNRSVEQQKPYIPSLSNLRDSGAIEQNAHIVMLLYRKKYYVDQQMLEDDGEEGDYLDIFISKNREGANGMVRTRFDGPTFSITDL